MPPKAPRSTPCHGSDHADEVDGTIAPAHRGVNPPAIAAATASALLLISRLVNLKSLAYRAARPAFVLARHSRRGAGMRGRHLRQSQATIITSSRSSPRATRTAPG